MRKLTIISVLSFIILAVQSGVYAQNSQLEKDTDTSPIRQYKPSYIIGGHPDTKIQVSMRWEMYKDSNFYLSYTQTNFWALTESSQPFTDINFNPSLFYELDLTNFFLANFIRFGFYEHESNGKDSNRSRTYDKSFLETNSDVNFFNFFNFEWSTTYQYVYNLESNNADLKEYYGWWQSRITFRPDIGYVDKESLSVLIISGGEYGGNVQNRYTYEIGLKFRTPFGNNFAPYLYIQYYDGYMDSLLKYDERTQAIRAGIILYR